MSQSEIFDAVRFAADSLLLDGADAWERALAAVEDLGAWDFDHYKPARPPLTLTSCDAMLKRIYPLSSATHLYLNPLRLTELRKRLRKAKVPRVKWRISWSKAVGVTS